MSLAELFSDELSAIKKTPITFGVGFTVLAILIGLGEYWVFKEVLDYQRSEIETLRTTIKESKGESRRQDSWPVVTQTSTESDCSNVVAGGSPTINCTHSGKELDAKNPTPKKH